MLAATMEGLRSHFGTVEVKYNGNASLNGEGNSGKVINNNNLTLNSFYSKFNLSNNNNSKLDIKKSEINSIGTSNAKISVEDSVLSLIGDTNVRVNGSSNKLELESNQNLKLDGARGTVKLKNNRNAKIFGDDNKIEANDNDNLIIKGSQNQLSVTGTINHTFEKVSGNTESKENTVKVYRSLQPEKESGGGGIWGFLTSRSIKNTAGNNVSYDISYHSEVTVSRDVYRIGIFNFKVENQGDQIQVQVDESTLDKGSLKFEVIKPGEVLLQGDKEGHKEGCRFSAPDIATDPNSTVFHIRLPSSARF